MSYKITFGFSRKLQAEPHGGNKFESIDFNAFVDYTFGDETALIDAYNEAKPELNELYELMRKDAIDKIKAESSIKIAAEKPKSPFASRGK